MSDPRSVLQAKFEASNRFANFGESLVQMHVKGFRCHTNTLIEIHSPITAFCGLNGTGKSTLLQLASVAYTKPDVNSPCYYINYFLVVGTLDPAPFSADARVEYKFWEHDRSLKSLTISRRAETKRWSGYTRRHPRYVLFAGVGHYLPRVEKHDFYIRYASKLKLEDSQQVLDHVKSWTCKVLGRSYENIYRHTVSYGERKEKVVSVERDGHRYSESHMGYGEGRTQHLITALESIPEKSLVLIEEPETSLHYYAQREFGNYLVDVATRRGHQILLTTHSEPMLAALPSDSRAYLHGTGDGIHVICGLTASQAGSLMAEGQQRSLNVLVEDEVAKAILTELLRRADPTILPTIGIHSAGPATTIKNTIKTISCTGLSVAAVLDADQQATPKENIFKLPGTECPERELLTSVSVQKYVRDNYDVSLADFSSSLAGVDHHEWIARLAQRLNVNQSALTWELGKVYAASIPELELSGIANQVREASRR